MPKVEREELQLELYRIDGYPCIRLAGEGECGGARHLEGLCERLFHEGDTRIILDTRSVFFLDPSCSEVLEGLAQQLEEEGGALVVVDQCLPVERSLKLLGLENRVHVAPSIAQATAYLDGRA